MPLTRVVIEFSHDNPVPSLVWIGADRATAEATVRAVPPTAKKRELHHLAMPYMTKYPAGGTEAGGTEEQKPDAGETEAGDPEPFEGVVEPEPPLPVAEPEQAVEELPAKPKRAPSLAPKG